MARLCYIGARRRAGRCWLRRPEAEGGRGLLQKLAMSVSARSRMRKVEYCARRIPEHSSVLLVGVSVADRNVTENLLEQWFFANRRCVGLSYDQLEPSADWSTVRGDARRLPFKDKSFDYIVSNAVIEHVGGIAGAQAMLAESTRVARRGYFHTTPNRRFPIEVHTRVPVLHWAPHRYQDQLFRRLTRFSFPPERYWLFTPASAKRLKPHPRVTRMGLTGMTFVLHQATDPEC